MTYLESFRSSILILWKLKTYLIDHYDLFHYSLPSTYSHRHFLLFMPLTTSQCLSTHCFYQLFLDFQYHFIFKVARH